MCKIHENKGYEYSYDQKIGVKILRDCSMTIKQNKSLEQIQIKITR